MSTTLEILLNFTRKILNLMLSDFKKNYSKSSMIKHRKKIKQLKKDLKRKNKNISNEKIRKIIEDNIVVVCEETGRKIPYQKWKSIKSAKVIKNFSRRSKYSNIINRI